jgi:acyl CoA:acetate/3-ketoacid CoA transferase alpha subunit
MTTTVPRSKVAGVAEAIAAVRPGMTLMVGGFGLIGAPLALIGALGGHPGARDLTIISNNLGEPGRGLGRLLLDGRVRKAVERCDAAGPERPADVQQPHPVGPLPDGSPRRGG